MGAVLRAAILLLVLSSLGAPLAAQEGPAARHRNIPPGELVSTGHRFFGTVSRGLASVIEKAVSQWGLPNGYILGQEAGGAFVAGLRYGEGTLYTRNAGDLPRVLARSVDRLRLGRRRRPHHDPRLPPARRPRRSTSASPASTARPISWAASA